MPAYRILVEFDGNGIEETFEFERASRGSAGREAYRIFHGLLQDVGAEDVSGPILTLRVLEDGKPLYGIVASRQDA